MRSSPQQPLLKKQDDLSDALASVDPTQAIVPSQIAPIPHHQPSNQTTSKPRPKLRRQSEEIDSVNPFDFTPAIAAVASMEKTNCNLKSDSSVETSEIKFEADVHDNVHEKPSSVSNPVSNSTVPGGSGQVTLVVIPTTHSASLDNGHASSNAVAKESAQNASEPASQAVHSLESSTPLTPEEES